MKGYDGVDIEKLFLLEMESRTNTTRYETLDIQESKQQEMFPDNEDSTVKINCNIWG